MAHSAHLEEQKRVDLHFSFISEEKREKMGQKKKFKFKMATNLNYVNTLNLHIQEGQKTPLKEKLKLNAYPYNS